jgi:hypothetical protein
MKSKLTVEIEQQKRVVQDKLVAYNEAHATTIPLMKEVESLHVSGKLTAKHKDRVSRANVLAKSLNVQAEAVLAEQKKLIALLDSGIRDQLEKQHGLLAYGLATGGLGPEAQLLHATIGDYLAATTDDDRAAADRSATLIWKHGTIIPNEAKPVSTVLAEFEALEGEQASAFYRENKEAIMAALQARQDAANQP